MQNNKMKVLLIDIETAPNKAYIWSLWKEVKSADFITDDWFIMCWCAKWLNKKKVMSGSLHTSRSYKKYPENDKELLLTLRDLLDEADIVVAHNGDNFDCKRLNTRFIVHGIKPPSPYKTVDTLKGARATFAFASNRLNDLGRFLKVGKKVDTGGFKLWKKCLSGDVKAWNKMVKYCRQDVLLLEKIYLKIRPYLKRHPNSGVYLDQATPLCPKCGHDKIHYQGYCYSTVGKFRKFQCLKCGSWGKERQNILSKEQRRKITRNIT